MLPNTPINKTLAAIAIAGVFATIGYKIGGSNKIIFTAGFAMVGLMASQAFVPFIIEPEPIQLTQKKNI